MLFVLSTFFQTREQTPDWLLGAALAGLGFALYLSYIEAYVLTTWCILCLISLAFISLLVPAWGALVLFGTLIAAGANLLGAAAVDLIRAITGDAASDTLASIGPANGQLTITVT